MVQARFLNETNTIEINSATQLTNVNVHTSEPTTIKTYIHDQAEAVDTWEINHKMRKFPSVTVVDSTDTVVEGSVTYIDQNNLTIKFNGAFKGKAYLN